MTYRDELIAANACQDAIDWVGDRDAVTAWRECERADWLLWEAERRKVPEHLLIRAACACARTALQYVPDGEDRPRLAIEAAEAVAAAIERGEEGGPLDALRGAAAAAASAACAARSAAVAASSAACAAWAAARSAWDERAESAARPAWAERAESAAAHKEMCRLIREIIPEPKGGAK